MNLTVPFQRLRHELATDVKPTVAQPASNYGCGRYLVTEIEMVADIAA